MGGERVSRGRRPARALPAYRAAVRGADRCVMSALAPGALDSVISRKELEWAILDDGGMLSGPLLSRPQGSVGRTPSVAVRMSDARAVATLQPRRRRGCLGAGGRTRRGAVAARRTSRRARTTRAAGTGRSGPGARGLPGRTGARS